MGRLLIVITGIVLGQAILYGPSLVGSKILLPLDILAERDFYLPPTPEVEKLVPGFIPHDPIMSDMVINLEPERLFAVSEIRAGRFPNWMPHEFAGVPCYRWSFSPPGLMRYLIASPKIHALTQMLVSLVAGLGAYVFFHRTMKVGFWPATIAAWCYPLTGSYIVWQGCGTPPVACWLPWLLSVIDKTVRQPASWGGLALAPLTAVVLVSGQTDVAGQTLLTSGIYAIWCCFDQYGRRLFSRKSLFSVGATGFAWTLGILASTWLLLPLVEYGRTGARMTRRAQGAEERPPVGLTALPQVIIPEARGLTLEGSFYLAPGNVPESSVGAYAGMFGALLLAPLAWYSRWRWSISTLWMFVVFVSLSWQLDIPGMVWLLRRPGLNIMSHNRFVFATSFSILAMAAIGLDVLWQRNISRRWWFFIPLALLAVTCTWCVVSLIALPEPIRTQLGKLVSEGRAIAGIHDMAGVLRVQHRFMRVFAVAAVLSGLGVAAWVMLWAQVRITAWHIGTVAGALIAELLCFAYGYNAQCDPSLSYHYTRIPVLDAVRKDLPGRIIGYHCLPADLAVTHDLSDIRGYDGVDPMRFIDLMGIAADPRSPPIPYALTQWLIPRIAVPAPNQVQLSPILDMFGVRYVVFRGSPPQGIVPHLAGGDYWVMANPRALPRAFVPERVETIADDKQRMQKLAAPDFDPRRVAYVESDSPINLPSLCHGSVSIAKEIPKEITLAAEMETPGLVVVADLWDKGWNAYLDGTQVPILRANHAIRGIVVPAGTHAVLLRYEPASLTWGLRLLGLAAMGWVAWLGGIVWIGRSCRATHEGSVLPKSEAKSGRVAQKTAPGPKATSKSRRRGRAE